MRKIAAVVLGALGVSLVVLSSHAQLDGIGIVAALGSMLSIATGGVLLNKWGKPPMSLLGFTGWQLLVTGVELTLVVALAKDFSARLDGTNWLGLIVLAVILTALPFALWFAAIAGIGAVGTAPFMLLVPITAFVLDALVKGTQPTGLQLVGAVLVMAGLVLSTRQSQGQVKPADSQICGVKQ